MKFQQTIAHTQAFRSAIFLALGLPTTALTHCSAQQTTTTTIPSPENNGAIHDSGVTPQVLSLQEPPEPENCPGRSVRCIAANTAIPSAHFPSPYEYCSAEYETTRGGGPFRSDVRLPFSPRATAEARQQPNQSTQCCYMDYWCHPSMGRIFRNGNSGTSRSNSSRAHEQHRGDWTLVNC